MVWQWFKVLCFTIITKDRYLPPQMEILLYNPELELKKHGPSVYDCVDELMLDGTTTRGKTIVKNALRLYGNQLARDNPSRPVYLINPGALVPALYYNLDWENGVFLFGSGQTPAFVVDLRKTPDRRADLMFVINGVPGSPQEMKHVLFYQRYF